MDAVRGLAGDRLDEHSAVCDPETVENGDAGGAVPAPIAQDERRMQVRAYNFWAGLLGNRQFPPADTLVGDSRPDFAEHAVLLHFDTGIENPAIAWLGGKLAEECDAQREIHRLADIPGRSLLSRITDHYMQIFANQAPIGFEAEFVNRRGCTILYRGILLPFSSNDETIDYIYGVINWKERADQPTGAAETHALPENAYVAAAANDADTGMPDPDEADAMGLGDWLAAARERAEAAHASEDRSRAALYDAIGCAWDFALAVRDAPADFAELLEDAGLKMQKRAPMTPVVKLVFGASYDKTRLTEYATALTHAQRIGMRRGEFGRYLADAPGGLKGVLKAERRLRREEAGKPAPSRGPDATFGKLRALAPKPLTDVAREGEEFALIMVRRLPTGEVALLGELTGDASLLERAARKLAG